MEQKRYLPLVLILLVSTAARLRAQPAEPRLTPVPLAVELGRASTPLSVPMLIKASLVLSGASESTIAADTIRLGEIIDQAKRAIAGDSSDYAKGNALLLFMHKVLLTRYSEPQTRLDTLLRTGEFNCVSSAVLYMILGRAVGLNVEGVYTPDHAFCTVEAKGSWIDVETTNRYGFDPGSKTAFHDAFGNTGFTYVPPGNYHLRTPTDGRGLLSFILQNRMSLLERRYRFKEAVGLAVDRYAILDNQTALDDLASEAGNYCAVLNQGKEYSTGIAFLDAVEKAYGRLPKLVTIMSGLIHNAVLDLANKGNYVQALTLIRERSASGAIDSSEASALRTIVAENRLSVAVKEQPFEKALGVVESSYRNGDISESTYHRYLVPVFGKEAQRTASANGYLAAVKILEQGIKMTGGSSELERGRRIYLNNYIATVHNRFAVLFNQREYEKATEVVREGLKIVPDSSVLNQDLQMIRRARGN